MTVTDPAHTRIPDDEPDVTDEVYRDIVQTALNMEASADSETEAAEKALEAAEKARQRAVAFRARATALRVIVERDGRNPDTGERVNDTDAVPDTGA